MSLRIFGLVCLFFQTIKQLGDGPFAGTGILSRHSLGFQMGKVHTSTRKHIDAYEDKKLFEFLISWLYIKFIFTHYDHCRFLLVSFFFPL